jgi:excisionase family DNA binding protein
VDQTDSSDSFLTVAEVAGILKLNQQTVRNWIDQGLLPALRVGRSVRIRRSDFERILAEGYTGGSGPGSASGDVGESGGPSSGEAGESGGPSSSEASGVPARTGQDIGPTAEDFWGGGAVGPVPALDTPLSATGNGNPL